MRNRHQNDDELRDDAFPQSRTRKKQADRALQRLGEDLLALSAEQLAAIEMPDDLIEAVRAGRRMTRHGARRRQLQYIGVLMRGIDAAPIREALEGIQRGDVRRAQAFKQLEAWRDALQEGQMAVVEEIIAQCPDADRQRLLQLVRNVRKTVGTDQAAKTSRMLFRYLREVYR
jgi:ribosome-associated protein